MLGLYDAFGMPEFDDMYLKYEKDKSIPKSTIGAQELFMDLLKERAETGRIYIMNIDHCNSHILSKTRLTCLIYVKRLPYLRNLFNT